MSYKRSKDEKHRLQKLYNNAHNSYKAGVYYNDEKKRIIKVYFPKSRRKVFKRYSNRIYRHQNTDFPIQSKRFYSKKFDLWWELF